MLTLAHGAEFPADFLVEYIKSVEILEPLHSLHLTITAVLEVHLVAQFISFIAHNALEICHGPYWSATGLRGKMGERILDNIVRIRCHILLYPKNAVSCCLHPIFPCQVLLCETYDCIQTVQTTWRTSGEKAPSGEFCCHLSIQRR